jgi:hypothetical protein
LARRKLLDKRHVILMKPVDCRLSMLMSPRIETYLGRKFIEAKQNRDIIGY